MHKVRAAMVSGFLLACLAFSVGCSSVSVSSERLFGAPSFPPTSPESVQILRREPRQPHDRIGHVFLEPSGHPPVAEMEQALRAETARLGGHAAVIVFDRTRRIGTVVEGPWWNRSAYPVYGRKIIAVAIRYRGERDRF
jgi:hypothetical protein